MASRRRSAAGFRANVASIRWRGFPPRLANPPRAARKGRQISQDPGRSPTRSDPHRRSRRALPAACRPSHRDDENDGSCSRKKPTREDLTKGCACLRCAPSYYPGNAILSTWTVVYSLRPSTLNSTPIPEFFTPPNGARGCKVECWFTHAVPHSRRAAYRAAVAGSSPHIEPPSPTPRSSPGGSPHRPSHISGWESRVRIAPP